MPCFKTVSYLDKACTGLEVFSLLVPVGWKFEGSTRWSVQNTMLPAASGFTISGDGIEIRALPGQAFCWTGLSQVHLSHPAGSRYLGATVCPPLSASEFIDLIMLPALRPDLDKPSFIGDSPPVSMGSLLGFDATFEYSGSASSSGSVKRLEYREGDKHYEEELYCTVTAFTYAIPVGGGAVDCTFWMADHLLSFRSEKGRLDGIKDLLQTIMYSFRFNSQWMDKYTRISLFLKNSQMHMPYSLRQLSADIDRTSGQRGDGLRTSEQRQSGYRWIADSLCGSGSTGEYYDPIQQVCVRLPAGYAYAWASDTGHYLLSNNGDEFAYYHFADVWKQMELISLESPALGEPATPASCA